MNLGVSLGWGVTLLKSSEPLCVASNSDLSWVYTGGTSFLCVELRGNTAAGQLPIVQRNSMCAVHLSASDRYFSANAAPAVERSFSWS